MAHVRRDLVYAEHPGYRPLSLDLHLPDAPHPPVVLFLHGGGWRSGSRRTFVPGLAEPDGFERITAEGWAVAAVDYRLSGEARCGHIAVWLPPSSFTPSFSSAIFTRNPSASPKSAKPT